MDVTADCEALDDAFYRAEEGEEFFNASLLGKERKGQCPFRRGKEHVGWILALAWRGD
jgi:hypothetical protein